MVDHLKQAKKSSKTEENVKKIKKLFAELNQVIDSQREAVISQMEGMPLDQQEAVVLYWEGVEQLMGEILDGLYEKFLQALERIKRGEKLDKNELRAYFGEIYETFKVIFTPEKYIMVEQKTVQNVNKNQYNQQNNDGAVGHSVHNGSKPRKNQSNDDNFNNSSFESVNLRKDNNDDYEDEDN